MEFSYMISITSSDLILILSFMIFHMEREWLESLIIEQIIEKLNDTHCVFVYISLYNETNACLNKAIINDLSGDTKRLGAK